MECCVNCTNTHFDGNWSYVWQHNSWSHFPCCISINQIIKISHPPCLLHAECVSWSDRSFYYFRPGRGSSHFVAYSSCYCSLSALWDACPDPPWHVTLEMTLSMRLTAGRQTSPCVPVSLPLPSLSVHCSSPSISASPHAVQVFTLSDSWIMCLWRILPVSSWISCNLSLMPDKVPAGVKSRA